MSQSSLAANILTDIFQLPSLYVCLLADFILRVMCSTSWILYANLWHQLEEGRPEKGWSKHNGNGARWTCIYMQRKVYWAHSGLNCLLKLHKSVEWTEMNFRGKLAGFEVEGRCHFPSRNHHHQCRLSGWYSCFSELLSFPDHASKCTEKITL